RRARGYGSAFAQEGPGRLDAARLEIVTALFEHARAVGQVVPAPFLKARKQRLRDLRVDQEATAGYERARDARGAAQVVGIAEVTEAPEEARRGVVYNWRGEVAHVGAHDLHAHAALARVAFGDGERACIPVDGSRHVAARGELDAMAALTAR